MEQANMKKTHTQKKDGAAKQNRTDRQSPLQNTPDYLGHAVQIMAGLLASGHYTDRRAFTTPARTKWHGTSNNWQFTRSHRQKAESACRSNKHFL
jgi:hypothetical protein